MQKDERAHDEEPKRRRVVRKNAVRPREPREEPESLPAELEASGVADPRYSGSQNLTRKAQVLLRLQASHGNAYVRRLVRDGPQAQPEDGSSVRASFMEAAKREDAKGEAVDVGQSTASRIAGARDKGEPLPSSVRSSMEAQLGLGLGHVRVHADAEADALARSVESEAFTAGSDIFFRAGGYAPGGLLSQGLLAHELAHVAHQTAQASPGHGDPTGEAALHADPVVQHLRSLRDKEHPGAEAYRQELSRFHETHPDAELDSIMAALGERTDEHERERPQPVTRVQRWVSSSSKKLSEEDIEEAKKEPEMSEDEMVWDVLNFFYPEEPPEELNDTLRSLAAQMVHDALKASDAMDYVPRPTGGRPDIKWLVKQAVKIAWRAGRKQQVYEIVRKVVAAKYMKEFRMAKKGAEAEGVMP